MPIQDTAKKNEYIRKWQATKRAADREICLAFPNGFYTRGKKKGCPRPVNPSRRAACAKDPVKFMRTYGPHSFYLTFSPGQLREVEIASGVILHGGQYAFAAPRGDGKTTRIEWLTLWAVLNGYHRAVVPVGATGKAAEQIMTNLKFELMTNDRLAEDYPEVCIPARLADDSAQRAKTLTLHEATLRFVWGTDMIVLPTIPGSVSRGSVIVPRGLTSGLRGMKFKIEGEGDIRPTLFLLDDPQTNESAKSPTQCDDREALVLGAVMGSGGPTDAIAAFMPCTIIEENDLAARFLNRDIKPEWHGTTRGMVVKFPDCIDEVWEKSPDLLPDLWEEYAELRREDFRNDMIIPEHANAFYAEHREGLEAGAVLDNPERVLPGDVSSMQTAMNYYLDRGRKVFFAEFMNAPESISSVEYKLTPTMVAGRCNGFPRLMIPSDTAFLVSMADVNFVGLNYAVIAFTNHLTAYIVDYGKYPEGNARLVSKKMTEHEVNQRLAQAVKELSALLDRKQFKDEGGEPRSIDRQLFDCNFWTKTMFAAIRSLQQPRKIMGDRGTASKDYRPARDTIKVGDPKHQCHIEKATLPGVMQVRHNADYWRMYAQKALTVAPGIPGSLSIFGNDPAQHGRLANEICNETLRRYEPGDPDLYAWSSKKPNDLLDAVVGCYPAAVSLGATIPGQESTAPRKKQRQRRRVGTSPTIRTRY